MDQWLRVCTSLAEDLIQFLKLMLGGSQPAETPASWNLVPSLTFVGIELIYVHTHTHIKTHN